MSRNSSRIQPPSQQNIPEQLKKPNYTKSEPNPFGISFVVPTSIVELPTSGEFYDKNSSMFGRDKIEVKQMTAKEEEILSNPDFIKDGTMLDRLIDSIVVDKTINTEDIFMSDKNAIIMHARIASYGPEYGVSNFCTACNTEQEFIFDLNKSKLSGKLDIEGVVYDSESQTYEFILPTSQITMNIRVLGPREDRYLAEQKERSKKLNLPFSDTLSFLRIVVVSANGVEDQGMLNKLFEVLPVLDIRMIKKVSNSSIPFLDTTQEVACGGCGHVTESEVPFSLGFFWPKL